MILIMGIILGMMACFGFGVTTVLLLIVNNRKFRNYIQEEIELINKELRMEEFE